MKITINPFYVAFSLITIGTLIIIWLFAALYIEGWWFWGGDIVFDKTGQIGDFIGGVVGTIFSLAGFVFLYLTLKEQRTSFRKERFEAKFFELVRLHRENVSQLEYETNTQTITNRAVFQLIFNQFQDAFRELDLFNKKYSIEIDDIINPDYKSKLSRMIREKGLKIRPVDIALIDIAYTILFYGVTKENEQFLSFYFRKKYKAPYFYKLIKFYQIKPERSHKKSFKNWESLIGLNKVEFKREFDEVYKDRNSSEIDYEDSFSSKLNRIINLKEKYYNGHQNRIGHYYRHLFQSFKYIKMNTEIDEDEKYFYAKTMRAQLSTFEQALLFINSVSSLGQKWELDSDIKLITDFHLIKNLPGTHFMNIRYNKFYPGIEYESLDIKF
jgi:hypothetical protein